MLKSEKTWYKNQGASVGYQSQIEFVDLDFDGCLELVMQYGGGSMRNCDADAFYFDGENVCLAGANDSLSGSGFQNTLTGYYNPNDNKYVWLGNSVCQSGVSYAWVGDFELIYNEGEISSNYYSSYVFDDSNYTGNPKYTYYSGANTYSDSNGNEEISKEKYDSINDSKKDKLININVKKESILCSDWEKFTLQQKYDALKKAYDGFRYDEIKQPSNEMRIYSDRTSMSIMVGDQITVGANVVFNDVVQKDTSGISFVVDDTSKFSVVKTEAESNCRYFTLKANAVGTVKATFSDSKTGFSRFFYITAYSPEAMAYTVKNIPTQKIDLKYTSNFYDINGMTIDNYSYKINGNGSCSVSFDVYNTLCIYGAVEVYDCNGNMKDVVVIDKIKSSGSSIKECVWDNSKCLINDLINSDLLTYRQQSGYAKQTPVSVTIPKDGYIKINTDPTNSFSVALINCVDILMSIKSMVGEIKGFDTKGKEFSEKLTKELLFNETYKQMIKDDSKYAKKLMKSFGKDIFFSNESTGELANTIVKNLNELNLFDVISKTAISCGWSLGESLFETFSGPIGDVLKGLFLFADLGNLMVQNHQFIKAQGSGYISIQNPSSGALYSSQIKVVTQDEENSETAIQAFEIKIEDEKWELYKNLINLISTEELDFNDSTTYSINYIKNGEKSEPNSYVEVYIPIPEQMKVFAYLGKVKIYRITDDGNVEEMEVSIKDDCLYFVTNHFSLYTIIPLKSNAVFGDFDGNGTVNTKDRIQFSRYLAKWIGYIPANEKILDLNEDGNINTKDRIILSRYLAKWVGYESLPYKQK